MSDSSPNLFIILVFLSSLIPYVMAGESKKKAKGMIPSLDTCECWENYKPVKQKNGDVYCVPYGEDQDFLRILCGRPKRPECKCSNKKAVTQIDEKADYWCVYKKGNVYKKWLCENEGEWKIYKKNVDAYLKKTDREYVFGRKRKPRKYTHKQLVDAINKKHRKLKKNN